MAFKFRRTNKLDQYKKIPEASTSRPVAEATQDTRSQELPSRPAPPKKQSPPNQPHFLESPLVTIRFDENDRRFHIHRSVLCSKSQYFAAILDDSDVADTQPKEILLREEDGHDAEAFKSVANWFYDGGLTLENFPDVVAARQRLPTSPEGDTVRLAQLSLTKVYVQADRLELEELKDEIFDLVFEISDNTLPNMQALHRLNQDCPSETPLERLFIDYISWDLARFPGDFENHRNGWHRQAQDYLQKDSSLAYKVLKALCDRSVKKHKDRPAKLPKSNYYEKQQL